MREHANKNQDDVLLEVEARMDIKSRQYDDGKDIVRPRDRELFRKLERIELTAQKSEVLFGNMVTAVFTNGSSPSGTVNHQTNDLEIPHTLGQIPADVIPGAFRPQSASGGGGTIATGTIIRGEKPWTDKNIYLRSAEAGTVRLYLMVE